ncbi:MAG: 1,2-phenylacetyl-CoA epoxidase subunit PaaE [Trebonia sp.]
MAREFRALTVARVDRLTADAAAITLSVPSGLGEEFAFRPGQSLTVRRPGGGRDERRSYSICSGVGDAPRIGVREVPGGAVSGWLVRSVRPGDTIEALPPSGSFTPDLSRGGEHVLIAAGSGITPVLSIASSLLRVREDTSVTLLYGNRRADTVMFADEVSDLKDAHPARVRLVHVLSREPREVDLFSGRLDAAKLRVLVPSLLGGGVASVAGWWLCGPLPMVLGATAVLGELGVAGSRIHRELFYVEDEAPEIVRHEDALVSGAEVTVILDGRKTSVAVPAGSAILDAAQRVRSDLPFACKGGVCGTCRARVVSGEARMRRNYALEPAEVDAGYVLTCQASPVSDSVTVDYDS